MTKTRYILLFFIFTLLPAPSVSFSLEMSSPNYAIPTSTMDSTGMSKSSPNFQILDSVGQSTPIGPSSDPNFNLEAGFIYGLQFSAPLDATIPGVIGGLTTILTDPTLTKQQAKDLNLAIQFLQDALNAFALYQAGDLAALANALNKTKSAINKLVASGIDTAVYQKMLAQAAELAVLAEINRIASLVGDTNLNVVQARAFLQAGTTEILNAVYGSAVQSFTQAYNNALLAI